MHVQGWTIYGEDSTKDRHCPLDYPVCKQAWGKCNRNHNRR